jgi:prepilin-type N-terminal cleavage/methylation domain-containing protein
MKKAFTMIELIFVIVILGILAAVALPKFLGVAKQAHEANLKQFVGTLNRTVGPTLWSQSISDGHNGDIAYLKLDDTNITKYIQIPKEIDKNSIDLGKCTSTTSDLVVMYSDPQVTKDYYAVTCQDGTSSQAPIFKLYNCGSNKPTDGSAPQNCTLVSQ